MSFVGPPIPGAVPGDWTGTLNGLSIGLGTNYLPAALHGWRTNAALPLGGASSGSAQLPAAKPFANGSWPVPYYMPNREVTLLLDVVATDTVTFADAVAALEMATQPQGASLAALMVQIDGVLSIVYGSFIARDIPTDLEYQFGLAQATVTMECPDPRRFGVANIGSTYLPHVSGGLTWPLTFPAMWSGTQDEGSVTMDLGGNTLAPVRLHIAGPCTSPTVTHTQSGSTLALDLTIASGDWVDIDCEARTVLYNGQSSRNGSLTSRGWFGFEPGSNTVGFNASAYNSTAILTVTATPAWI